MEDIDQFSLAIQALRSIQAETNGTDPLAGQIIFPGLADAIEKLGSLPPLSTLLGIASDGLPVLLRLDVATPGPILILGDRGSGKTAFLQALMRTTLRLHPVKQIGITVLTDFPDDWRHDKLPLPSLGLWPAYERGAREMLFYLSEWARTGGDDHAVLLLIDGLDFILHHDRQAQDALFHLLKAGPRARVWPIVTINAARAEKMPEWMEHFYTRIYGRVSHPDLAEAITPMPGAPLAGLFPGAEFCMRQRSRWLHFWLPGHA